MCRSQQIEMCDFQEIEMCHFRESEMCHFREIEMCHFREIEMFYFWEIELCHSRRLKYVIFTILQFSGDWNWSFRDIKLAVFERLKCFFFFRGIEHDIFGELKCNIFGKLRNWTVQFLENWILHFLRQVNQSTPEVGRICHEIQPAS